jgi:hypothetical protein
MNVWSINVIVFALWFWALDRGTSTGEDPGDGPNSR